MICQRCNATMIKRQDGTPYCYPCAESTTRQRIEMAAATVDCIHTDYTQVRTADAAFRLLQERVAKLESAMADLKRRTEPQAPVAVRFLGQFAGEPSLGEPGETR